MSDVRINGRRFPILKAVDNLNSLIQKMDSLGQRNNTCLTTLTLNNRIMNIDATNLAQIKLTDEDIVEARMESSEQLAYESLHVAQEMAELMVFDIKVATLHLWDNLKQQYQSLETLLTDCNLFLTLAARPHELLGIELSQMTPEARKCLQLLDVVANNLEDATLLAATQHPKDACHVLVARVLPALENWMGYTPLFAEQLKIEEFKSPVFAMESGQLSEIKPSSGLPGNRS